jgi:uncharacterized membrane protein YczE
MSIEVTVFLTGFALGGTVGVGTLVYALSIGPLAHFFIPLLAIRDASSEDPLHQYEVEPAVELPGDL